jgi:branched-chain amino acid transport system ATP-binding protein
MDSEQILTLERVKAFYNHTEILHGINLMLMKGESCCLAGRIGAGKTTTLKAILGLLQTSGSIRFRGKEIRTMATFRIANMGIGYVPEGRKLYGELTVNENLEMAMAPGRSSKDAVIKAYDFFPELKDKKSKKAKVLSGGERQMLSIARALIGKPQLLFMDEPYEGLAVPIIRRLNQAFQEIRKRGLTIFVTWASLKGLESIADRVYIIDRGEIIFNGAVEEARNFTLANNLIL